MERSQALDMMNSATEATVDSHGVDRRRFAFAAALSSAALLSGCHSQPKPSREATLLHNGAVRESVTELEQAMNMMEERIGQFNAENWQDALANLQTSAIRMHNSIDELKRALGYRESGKLSTPPDPALPG